MNLGIHYIGLGISGGADGARFGPAMMVGGSINCYKTIEPILGKLRLELTTKKFARPISVIPRQL